MVEDVAELAREITPYVATAVGAYGTAVLTRVGEDGADATVSFGRRVLLRLTGRGAPDPDGPDGPHDADDPAEPTPEQTALARTVDELARTPDDRDTLAVLRVQIRRILTDDPALAAQLAGWPRPQAPGTTTITATGDRSVAVNANYGQIQTGDTVTGDTVAPPHDQP